MSNFQRCMAHVKDLTTSKQWWNDKLEVRVRDQDQPFHKEL